MYASDCVWGCENSPSGPEEVQRETLFILTQAALNPAAHAGVSVIPMDETVRRC